MRKIFCVLSLAAATALAASAAQAAPYDDEPNTTAPAEVGAGVVGGTVVGLGLTEGWWGASPAIAGAALPTTAAGAAAVGGVAGIGAIAAIDAVVQPCRGFHALFGLNHGACVNGHYVGYAAPRVHYRRRG